MNTENQNYGREGKPLHHGAERMIGGSQSVYIKNKAHEDSGGLDWVKDAFRKATLGTVRKLNQSA